MGRIAPAPDRRVDRRPAARARRAPQAGDVRPYPEAHRGAFDQRALHGNAPAGSARGLPRRICEILVREFEHLAAVDQPLYAAGGRVVGGTADQGRSPARGGRFDDLADEIPEAEDAEGDDRELFAAAALTGRL